MEQASPKNKDLLPLNRMEPLLVPSGPLCQTMLPPRWRCVHAEGPKQACVRAEGSSGPALDDDQADDKTDPARDNAHDGKAVDEAGPAGGDVQDEGNMLEDSLISELMSPEYSSSLSPSVGKTKNMGFPGHGCLIFGPMGYDPVDEDLKKFVRPDCVGEVANDDLQDIIGPKLCSRSLEVE